MKNLFICHRPYHILRSADVIFKNYLQGDNQNVLIDFNVINVNTNNYQDNQPTSVLDKYFSKAIHLSRSDEVSIWDLKRFRHYYNEKISYYKSYVEELSDFDNLFFFSDLEKPVEILVGLLKEKKSRGAEITIIDEGCAAYYRARPYWKSILKSVVVFCGRFKYLNHSANYGQSLLYTSAMATFPELCVFRKVPITKMLPLDNDYLNEVLSISNLPININEKYIIYLSTVIDIEFRVLPEMEFDALKKMITIAEKYNFHFYIKPHPIQDVTYYKKDPSLRDHVINTQLPAEVFFSENAIIASVGSSSLINAKVQGVRSIELSKLFKIDTGLPSFGVFSPSDITEYEQYVNGKSTVAD